ncbi:MAG TPA: HD domain-containing protein [Candidatus Sabulitectum sp.]|nr:HD domain-containing protein [Candidatus Sabulitectum sp.]HPF32951.1 HD domain-containing protein [Candidatus Sabulitectum sp.]HPJ28077.1 HD domain-containing protein [Candidatus Sabulitectum sp.]HPR21263.1 HD domain-containing protein [Candidatus Sabulitectum sp.]HRW77742.1 HD domain-containing protein [Candidatus Sabulitectum sp.]
MMTGTISGENLRGKTALVVDDESAIREILGIYLEELGLNVLSCSSVEDARNSLSNFDVDLILSDIAMPGGENGIDFLRWCRKRRIISPFILISGYVTSEAVRDALAQGVQYVIHKPFSREQLSQAILSSFAVSDSYTRLLNSYLEEIERSNDLFLATIDGFAAAVGARDGYTLDHSRQVAGFAVLLATKIGLDGKNLRTVRIAGELHDIGKIGVPEKILLKEELLTRGEYGVMKTHAEKSAEILSPMPNLDDVVKAVRSHHERYDGGGYPDGLSGEEIPLLGRILAVCDAFSAMITERPYRARISPEEARQELHARRGEQFDPDLVDAFLAIPEIACM